MSSDVPDVVILGGGMGGYPAAIRAAQLGLKVTLVEADKLGGTCLHVGCIPTKALLESSELFHRVSARGKEFGVDGDNLRFDYVRIAARRDAVVSQLYKGVQYLMKKNKIEVVAGSARTSSNSPLLTASKKTAGVAAETWPPCCSNSTTSAWPPSLANCIGVLPSWSLASSAAWRASNNFTTSPCP